MSNTNTTNTTAAPKSDSHTAAPAAASPFGSFDPMAMWATTQQTWAKLMTDAVGRAQSYADQYVTIEGQLLSRTHDAIGTWAQLTHEALTYSAQLSGEARKMGFDAVRKMGAAA